MELQTCTAYANFKFSGALNIQIWAHWALSFFQINHWSVWRCFHQLTEFGTHSLSMAKILMTWKTKTKIRKWTSFIEIIMKNAATSLPQKSSRIHTLWRDWSMEQREAILSLGSFHSWRRWKGSTSRPTTSFSQCSHLLCPRIEDFCWLDVERADSQSSRSLSLKVNRRANSNKGKCSRTRYRALLRHHLHLMLYHPHKHLKVAYKHLKMPKETQQELASLRQRWTLWKLWIKHHKSHRYLKYLRPLQEQICRIRASSHTPWTAFQTKTILEATSDRVEISETRLPWYKVAKTPTRLADNLDKLVTLSSLKILNKPWTFIRETSRSNAQTRTKYLKYLKYPWATPFRRASASATSREARWISSRRQSTRCSSRICKIITCRLKCRSKEAILKDPMGRPVASAAEGLPISRSNKVNRLVLALQALYTRLRSNQLRARKTRKWVKEAQQLEHLNTISRTSSQSALPGRLGSTIQEVQSDRAHQVSRVLNRGKAKIWLRRKIQ